MSGPDNSRRLIGQNRTAGSSFDLYDNRAATTIYCDGIGSLGLGPAVSRVSLQRTVGFVNEEPGSVPGVAIEEREINANIVIPTAALLELSSMVISAYLSNQDIVDDAVNTNKQLLNNFLKNLPKSADK